MHIRDYMDWFLYKDDDDWGMFYLLGDCFREGEFCGRLLDWLAGGILCLRGDSIYFINNL